MTLLLEILYIISISLQIAGAIILIIRYWSKPIAEQLEANQKRKPDVKDEVLILGNDVPSDSEYSREIKLNRIAFVYIALGYIIGIWGSSFNKLAETLAILLVSIFMIFIGLKIATLNIYKNA